MVVSYTRIILVFIITKILSSGDTQRLNLKAGITTEPRDRTPSKWATKSAMDVWFGNKSMIDVISREFSDILYKFTSRPVRSSGSIHVPFYLKSPAKPDQEPADVSRVEINFFNEDNQSVHTIMLIPGYSKKLHRLPDD